MSSALQYLYIRSSTFYQCWLNTYNHCILESTVASNNSHTHFSRHCRMVTITVIIMETSWRTAHTKQSKKQSFLAATEWSRAPGDPTCRCGHTVVPPLAVCETQPVHFAPQYKTRYPFYRWVGWLAGGTILIDRNFPPALGSNWRPLGYEPKISPADHQGTHVHTYTYTRTHTMRGRQVPPTPK